MPSLVVMVMALVTGCATVPRATEGGHLKSFWGNLSSRDFLRVRGVGVVPVGVNGQTRRRALSRNAALAAARLELLGTIRGVKLEAGITVSMLMERDSVVRELADDMVRGGDEIFCEWTDDDSAVVTLELKRSKVERLIQKKSKHETDLEARVTNDIDEIKRLQSVVQFLTDDHMKKNTDDKLIELETVGDLAAKVGSDRIDTPTLKRLIEDDISANHGIMGNAKAELCKKYPDVDPDCPALMRDWGVTKW